jgi:hypothetical protein
MSQAQMALEKAERLDGYRAACAASPLNAAAREKQSYTPSFLDKNMLDALYRNIIQTPLLGTANIVVLDSSADNGYPHTRANSVVCMPKSAIITMSPDRLKETLCHEGIHLHQRWFPDLWSQACYKEGWTPVQEFELPQDSLERCRINPDTFQPQRFWAWQTHYVPMPLFIRDDTPTMEGVQIKWFDRRMAASFVDPPPSFSKRYGSSPPQPEHPFELLAVEYSAQKLNSDALLRAKLTSL